MAPAWVVQADDLTGAADTAVGFAVAGLETFVLPWAGAMPGRPPQADVLAVDTASRDVDATVAAARAGEVAAWFASRCAPGAWLYKKVDSTLRGNVAAEVAAAEAALEAAGRGAPRTVVAPAFPALGRTTAGGVQRWDGGSADVAALLGGAGREVADAARDEDLAALAAELAASAERPLLVGSGGLAAAFAARLGDGAPGTAEPLARPVLVVSGSATALAARQLAALHGAVRAAPDDPAGAARALGAGRDVVLAAPSAPQDGDVAAALGVAAAGALRDATPGTLLVVGGDTALAVCTALGVRALRARREAAPGAPLLEAALDDGRTVTFVLKSGSFGTEDLLARLLADAA